MSSSSKFYSLSEELLTAIAEEVITETCDTSDLKALRLSSPRFAYLRLIQQNLFGQGIQFIATPEHLERLAQSDFSEVAPFVKTVSFVAPPKCWGLTFEGFKEMIIGQAIEKYEFDRQTWNALYYQEFIDRFWDGVFPLPGDQIQAGFEQYRKDALAAKDVLLGEELRAVWTSALRALQNVHDFRFKYIDYNVSWTSHQPVQPDCIARPYKYNGRDRYQATACLRGCRPVGDVLFAVGTACLAEANVKVQSLSVGCSMTGQFGWENLPSWEELDLSQMRTFVFQPKVPMAGEDVEKIGGPYATAERAADAVAAVLKKCGDTLEKFTYDGFDNPMKWPGDKAINLPRLTDLSLHSGAVVPGKLRAWMHQMPSLEHLQLDYIWMYEAYPGWLDIFDAIRDHPQALHVYFDTIMTNAEAELSLDYYTDDFEWYLSMQEAEDPWNNIERSVALYLSGEIECNESLKMWLRENQEEEEDD